MDIDLENLRMEDINGEKHIEREYTAYAELQNFDWIDSAPHVELHEQWQIDYASKAIRGRLRLINNRRYTEAVKQPLKGSDGYYECENDISPDMYEMKKLGCTNGYLKERYNFPIEGTDLKWEIDVFKSRSGGRSKWVKIDLEFNSPSDPIPDFPIAIVGNPIIVERVMPAHVEDFIDSLWNEEWLKLDHASARSKGTLL